MSEKKKACEVVGSREWWVGQAKYDREGVVDCILRLMEQGEISRGKARELVTALATFSYIATLPTAPWEKLNWCDER